MKARQSLLSLASVVMIAGLVGGCATGIGGSPPPPAIPRVGLMHVGTDHVPPSLGTLVGRLAELGWMDGTNDELVAELTEHGRIQGPRIELIWRNLEPGEVEEQAAEFVREHVDVIVAFEDKSIAAAQAATAEADRPIAVVFLHPSDPVRDGLVKSLPNPGGNLTGVFGARDPITKQLELYQQIMPGLRRLLTLVDPTDMVATPPLRSEALEAAERLGIELDIREASGAADLERAFRMVAPGEVDGAFLLSPSLRLNFSKRAIELADEANLPVQAHRKEWVEQGALFSLGVDVGPVGRAAARFVDSILKGTPPAELPVEEVNKTQFALNLGRAAELHIEVPQEVIDLAFPIYR